MGEDSETLANPVVRPLHEKLFGSAPSRRHDNEMERGELHFPVATFFPNTKLTVSPREMILPLLQVTICVEKEPWNPLAIAFIVRQSDTQPRFCICKQNLGSY